jgi:hypothetical protein
MSISFAHIASYIPKSLKVERGRLPARVCGTSLVESVVGKMHAAHFSHNALHLWYSGAAQTPGERAMKRE